MKRHLALAACLTICAAAPARADDGFVDVIVRVRTSAAPVSVFPAARAARAGAIEEALRYRLRARSGLARALRADRAAGALRDVRPLWIIGGYAVSARPAAIARLRRRPDVLSVAADESGARPATVATNLALLGIPDVWAHAGTGTIAATTGEGVTVAVLDTGVAPYYQLGPSWRGGAHDWLDPYGQFSSPADVAGPTCSGHGTEVTNVILGGDDGTGLLVGAAPGARWIAARIFNSSCHSTESAIHQAFQWVLDPDGDPATPDGADVVNNSWDEQDTACLTTFQPDLTALRNAGILPVFAAGNTTLSGLSPANLPEAFAVGALETDTTPRSDSAHGPSTCGQPFPAVAAPGTSIPTIDRFGLPFTGTGTSLAAPHVTGILALVLSRHPGMTAAEQAAALTSTAVDVFDPGVDTATGAGRPDALAAFESALPAPRDVTAPQISAAAATPAVVAGYVTITGHASDAAPGARVTGQIAGAEVSIDGGASTPAAAVDGSFDGAEEDLSATIPTTGLAEGDHTALLVATDDSANGAIGATASFTVDRTAPVLAPPTIPVSDGTGDLTVDVTDPLAGVDGGEWFEGADPGQGGASALAFRTGTPGDHAAMLGASIATADLAPGWHVIEVRALDGAGNWSDAVTVSLHVGRFILHDSFGHGLGRWSSVQGRIDTDARAAISGHRGLLAALSARRAFVESAAPPDVRSLDASFRIDVRRATIQAPVTVLQGFGRDRRTAVSVEVRHPAGYRATIRTCVRRPAAACSGWVQLGSAAHLIRLVWAADGAQLSVDGAPISTVAGPLTGRVDTIRFGAVRVAAASRGSLYLDEFSAARAD